tara:strand:+ start:334 stop:540 length:207 start_codon:yes stop_codon:yes gene_type:complete
MGSKSQRQNKHARRLKSKIRRFEKKEKNTDGLKRELAYATGEADRPAFKTGSIADIRNKRSFVANDNE